MIPENMRGKFITDHLALIYQRLSELEEALAAPRLPVGTGLGKPEWDPTSGEYFPPES